MEQQQPQLNLDLSKTTPLFPPSGGKVWQQGIILRQVSKFITGTSEDALIPIPVFYDPETKEVLTDSLPKEIKDDYMVKPDLDNIT